MAIRMLNDYENGNYYEYQGRASSGIYYFNHYQLDAAGNLVLVHEEVALTTYEIEDQKRFKNGKEFLQQVNQVELSEEVIA